MVDIKKTIFVVLLFFIFCIPLYASEYGLYFTSSGQVVFDGRTIGSLDFDKNYCVLSFTSSRDADFNMNMRRINAYDFITIKFEEPFKALSVYHDLGGTGKISNNEYRVTFFNSYNPVPSSSYIYIFLDKDGSLPEPKVSINTSTFSSSVNISDILNGTYSSFDIFLNDALISNVPVRGGSLKQSVSYTLNNLVPGNDYVVRIRGKPSSDTSYTPYDNSFKISTSSLTDISYSTNITDSSCNIVFDDITDLTNEKFEISFDGKSYVLDSNSYDFNNLLPDKSYNFKVRLLANGLKSNWVSCSFRTLPWLKAPSDIEDLKVVGFGVNFIRVEVVGGLYASEYSFYLDGSLVDTVSSNSFTYLNLNPNTEYTLGVVASNKYGASNLKEIKHRTNEPPPPRVFSLTSSISDSENTMKRLLKWSSEYVKDGFEIFIDKVSIETLDDLSNEYLVDFSSLGYTEDDTVLVEVVPIDSKGIGASLSVDLKFNSSGLSSIDTIIVSILNGIDLMLSSGVFLILKLIPFIILFMTLRFLFKKFRHWIGLTHSRNNHLYSIKNDSAISYNDNYIDKHTGEIIGQPNEVNNIQSKSISDEDFIKQYKALSSIRGHGVLPEEGYYGVSSNEKEINSDKRINSLLNEISRLR